MKKKDYKKPVILDNNVNAGLPTVAAVFAVGAAVGASSVAVGKMVGDIHKMKTRFNSTQPIIGGLNE